MTESDPKPAEPKAEPPSLMKLDSDKLDDLEEDPATLPDPELLSPKSAKIVRLMQKVQEKDKALAAATEKLARTQYKNKALLVKNRSESFKVENLQKLVSEAKDEMNNAVSKAKKAETKLASKQQEFSEKYEELYKAQEDVYKEQQEAGRLQQTQQSA